MEHTTRNSLYTEVTQRIIAELEQGRLPWVQPWDTSLCGCTMPHNAATDRRYSGINVLILWAEVVMRGYGSQRWLTYRQAQAAGGNVRKGEKGTTVCYADRFTPKAQAEQARGEDREARTVAFLKRFTVFNIDQCEGLPEDIIAAPVASDPVLASALAKMTGSARTVRQQNQWLAWAAGLALILGWAGGSIIPPAIDWIVPEAWQWPEKRAESALRRRGWEAGERLLSMNDPERWKAIQAAARMSDANSHAIAKCASRAAEQRLKSVGCSIEVSATD